MGDQGFQFSSIGVVRTIFKEKFGVPKQSMMISEAKGVLTLHDDARFKLAIRNLEGISHLWVVFVFHKHLDRDWRPLIEQPRPDAPEKVGVFASRSPHRPNAIGISVVKLEHVEVSVEGRVVMHLSGVDMLDETPVLDIKPYLPFVDRIEDASAGWAKDEIQKVPVRFSDKSFEMIRSATEHPNLLPLLVQILELDPRPHSQKRAHPIDDAASDGHRFGFRILDFNVKWRIESAGIYVDEIESLILK